MVKALEDSPLAEKLDSLLASKPAEIASIMKAVTEQRGAYRQLESVRVEAVEKLGVDKFKWPADVVEILENLNAAFEEKKKVAIGETLQLATFLKHELGASGGLPKLGFFPHVIEDVSLDFQPGDSAGAASVKVGVRLLNSNRLQDDDAAMVATYKVSPNGAAAPEALTVAAMPFDRYLTSDNFAQTLNRLLVGTPSKEALEKSLNDEVSAALGLEAGSMLKVRVSSRIGPKYLELRITPGNGVHTERELAYIEINAALSEAEGKLKLRGVPKVTELNWR